MNASIQNVTQSKAMVNVGSTTFIEKYDLLGTFTCGGIYALDVDFAVLMEYPLNAYKLWSEQRQWFTNK